MIEVVLKELIKLTDPDFYDEVALNRAKNTLKASLFMHLERRSAMCDDLGISPSFLSRPLAFFSSL